MGTPSITFEQELRTSINKYGKDNNCDTPDFILARYLRSCLFVFTTAIVRRDALQGKTEPEDDKQPDAVVPFLDPMEDLTPGPGAFKPTRKIELEETLPDEVVTGVHPLLRQFHPGHGHTETLPVPEDESQPPDNAGPGIKLGASAKPYYDAIKTRERLTWAGMEQSLPVEGHAPDCKIDLDWEWTTCSCGAGL